MQKQIVFAPSLPLPLVHETNTVGASAWTTSLFICKLQETTVHSAAQIRQGAAAG